jgi:hypothetical protein
MKYLLLILTILAIVLPAILPAQTTLSSAGEAYVTGGINRFTIYGADTTLRVRSSPTSADVLRRIYIKFDLSSVSGSIDVAKLKMVCDKAVNDSTTTPPYALDRADFFTVSNDTWREDSITYKLSDSLYPRQSYLFSQQFVRRASTDPDTTYEWDVTSYVQTEYSGDKVVSFCLLDTTKNRTNLYFWSKRNKQGVPGPLLIINPQTGVNDNNGFVPDKFLLKQNYPNPFNPVTTIDYSVPSEQFIKLVVFDNLGRNVATLVNENKSPGNYTVKFDASKLSSGLYYCSLTSAKAHDTKIMVLLK